MAPNAGRKGKAQSDQADPGQLDPRLITEFDGTTDVVEWLSRAELICSHRGVDVMDVIPLRLTGGAFAVWSQATASLRRPNVSDDCEGSFTRGLRAGRKRCIRCFRRASTAAWRIG